MATVMAARSVLFDMINVKLAQGEFFDESDEKAKRRVAVIGKKWQTSSFRTGMPLDKP